MVFFLILIVTYLISIKWYIIIMPMYGVQYDVSMQV